MQRVTRLAGVGLCLGVVWLALATACRPPSPPPTPTLTSPPPSATPSPTWTPTPTLTPTPSPTPEPLAARVNGQPIRLADYEAALTHNQLSLPDRPPAEVQALTLEMLIDQALLEQEASARQVTVAPAEVTAVLSETISLMGGETAYAAWLTANHWSDAAYREALADEMLAARVIEAITADVPYTTEFVRARVIELHDLARAQEALAQLQGGGDFLTVLSLYSVDPNAALTQGDIGFFDRGTLLVPAIEEAAFALQPGAFSDIIPVTRADGTMVYYIVQTTAREPFRPYSLERRAELTRQAFESWLATQRAQAQIEVFLAAGP